MCLQAESSDVEVACARLGIIPSELMALFTNGKAESGLKY
jgi:hypothetical protein